jgi:RNA polymerase sigma factor (sigma-70 family)
MTDLDLLREYDKRNSEEAFEKLVQRHLNLVYSVAYRRVRSREFAEEVTQSVFIHLARKASTFKGNTVLTAWLYQVTRACAIDVLRRESRRQAREQIAYELNNMNAHPDLWQQIEPFLEEAMQKLNETERSAILLRYFEGKSLLEVGEELGASEDTVQKRISRAVEKIRNYCSMRGIRMPAAGLVAVISANAVQSAPIALNPAVLATAAISNAALCEGTFVGIVKGITMTTIQKTAITATIAIAIGTTIFEAQRASKARSELASMRRELNQNGNTVEIEELRQHFNAATNTLDSLRKENEELRRQASEIYRLRGEIGLLRKSASELAKANDGSEDTNPVRAAMKSWLNRVDQLRQRFDASPDQKIPEFELLNDDDWLGAAKTELVTEEDYRRAMSKLRGTAESKFADILQTALRKYRDAHLLDHDQKALTDISELPRFADNPIDQTMLQRYSVFPPDILPSVRVGGDWVISQKGPVDAEYDTRFVIGASGGRGSDAFKKAAKNAP